jgi:hypothetical protein
VWLRVAEDIYMPAGELVGFFAPDVLDREAGNDTPEAGGLTGRKALSFALMRDGGVLPMPFTTKSLAGRFKRSGAATTKR